MGAGYPIGAVVTRRDIAERLAKDYEYFSTFAATPVAAAAGNTVLDLLVAEGLAERATATGEYLRASLVALSERHARLGSVRGTGLLAGVDLGEPGEQGGSLAKNVLNDLAQRGVLVGLTGLRGDVLKVRPPLVWRDEHVDRFVQTLDASLSAL
jgi:4-aminobutyrate aminotransferase-like enzyme